MKITQLRYLQTLVEQQFNVSRAASVLHTSQPGVSKQIQLLEQSLGIKLFQRNGKRLVGLTTAGIEVLKLAQEVLLDIKSIQSIANEFSQSQTGTLTIATTHTQARYKLPVLVKQFMAEYPEVKLVIHQGNPTQVAEEVLHGKADIGIASEYIHQVSGLSCRVCYQWNRCLVTLPDHPLTQATLDLELIARYPLITYDYAFAGSVTVAKSFAQQGLTPNIVLTAVDSDVIKTYVELGLGVGLLAHMAYDKMRDSHLIMLDVAHLFPTSTTYLAVRQHAFLPRYLLRFIDLLTDK